MAILTVTLGPNSCYLQVADGETSANVVAAITAQIVARGWTLHDSSVNVFSAPTLGTPVKYVRLQVTKVGTYYYGALVPYESWNASTHDGVNPCYRSSAVSTALNVRNGFKLTHNTSYRIYIFASARWLAMASTQDNAPSGFEYAYSDSTNTYQGASVDHYYEIASFAYTQFLGNVSGCFEIDCPVANVLYPLYGWLNTAVAFDMDTTLDASTDNASLNVEPFRASRAAFAEARDLEIAWAPRLKGAAADLTGAAAGLQIAGMYREAHTYRHGATYSQPSLWNGKYQANDVHVKTSENMHVGRFHGLKLAQPSLYAWGQTVVVPCGTDGFCKVLGNAVDHFAVPVTVAKNWTYARYHRYSYSWVDGQGYTRTAWATATTDGPYDGTALYTPTFLIPL